MRSFIILSAMLLATACTGVEDPDGENEEEVIDGTGLEWPASDEIFGPVALAVVGFVLVMAIAQIGKRFES